MPKKNIAKGSVRERLLEKIAKKKYEENILNGSESSDPEVIRNLAIHYMEGTGVPKDEAKAFQLFERASGMGSVAARYDLGIFYLQKIETITSVYGKKAFEKKAFECFKSAAEMGSAYAQWNLAMCYSKEAGASQDDKLAFEWASKAAEQGHAEARLFVLHCMSEGVGTDKDDKKAFGLFKKLADEEKNTIAQAEVGKSYLYGLHTNADPVKAIQYLTKAAAKKYVKAQALLAWCYASGVAGKRDDNLAAQLWKEAAQHGDIYSQTKFGICLLEGVGIEKSKLDAAFWLNKAANAGNAEAQLHLSRIHYSKRHYKEAFNLCASASKQGHLDAMNQLGFYYRHGIGISRDEKKARECFQRSADLGSGVGQSYFASSFVLGAGSVQDYRKAFEIYKKDADRGDAIAKGNLAFCYFCGFGVPHDKKMAYKLFKDAALAGYPEAMASLANFYLIGDPLTGKEGKDEKSAVKLLKEALSLKDNIPLAQKLLGECYENGWGVTKEVKEARKLYIKAASAGLPDAEYNLGMLIKKEILESPDEEKNEEKAAGIKAKKTQVFEYISSASKHSHLKAKIELAKCYKTGFGTGKKDEEAAFELFEEAAATNDTEAQYQLGLCYGNGAGIEQNLEYAFDHYEIAALQHHPRALNNIGICLRDGRGVEKDVERAFASFQEAASLGNDNARFNLARCYENGTGTEKSEFAANEEYKKLSGGKPPYIPAVFELGRHYEEGTGLLQNPRKAFQLYRIAAEAGNPKAQIKLAACYLRGTSSIKQNFSKAVEWFTKVASEDYPEAWFELGKCYENGLGVTRDYTQALECYNKAILHQNAEAKYRLGLMLLEGRAGIAKDEKAALKLLEDAASNDKHIDSLLVVADHYAKDDPSGLGKTHSDLYYKKAIALLEESAKKGDAEALYKLGTLYKRGNGVLQDAENAEKAATYFKLAAEKWHPNALFDIAECYADGRGVPQNKETAFKYYKKAAKSGHIRAKYNVAYILETTKNDLKAAVENYHAAAIKGDVLSQLKMGHFCSEGVGEIPEDKKAAFEWYLKAAEQKNPEAAYEVGRCYEEGEGVERDPKKAVTWYQQAAEGEEPFVEALVALGRCCQNRIGIEALKQDQEQKGQAKEVDYYSKRAVAYFIEAAKQEDDEAEYELGNCYEHGLGTPIDQKKAFACYHKAAELGHAKAQLQLGLFLQNGIGCEANLTEAARWYEKASLQEETEAQLKFAECYEKGEGVPKDLELARKYYRLAAQNDSVDAQRQFERLQQAEEKNREEQKIAVSASASSTALPSQQAVPTISPATIRVSTPEAAAAASAGAAALPTPPLPTIRPTTAAVVSSVTTATTTTAVSIPTKTVPAAAVPASTSRVSGNLQFSSSLQEYGFFNQKRTPKDKFLQEKVTGNDDVIKIINELGICYPVGGVIDDFKTKGKISDLDLVTSLSIVEIKQSLGKLAEKYPTLLLSAAQSESRFIPRLIQASCLIDGKIVKIDITSRPHLTLDNLAFEAWSLRDFTKGACFWSEGVVYYPIASSKSDREKNILSTIKPPVECFLEDPKRMFRAVGELVCKDSKLNEAIPKAINTVLTMAKNGERALPLSIGARNAMLHKYCFRNQYQEKRKIFKYMSKLDEFGIFDFAFQDFFKANSVDKPIKDEIFKLFRQLDTVPNQVTLTMNDIYAAMIAGVYKVQFPQGKIDISFINRCMPTLTDYPFDNEKILLLVSKKLQEMAAKPGSSEQKDSEKFFAEAKSYKGKDDVKAFEHYAFAAELGHTEAEFELATCYANGSGVAKDEKRAAELFKITAEKGLARGQYAYGDCLENGKGTYFDPVGGARYFTLASNQGYQPAKNALGIYYEKRGIPRAVESASSSHFIAKAMSP